MNASQKFLFDHDFEPPEAGAAGHRTDSGSATSYTEEELTAARREGFEAGKQAGEQAAVEAAEQRAARALDEVSKKLTDLLGAVAEAGERRDREVIETATAFVGKLFPALARTQGLEEIEALVGECLGRLQDEPRIVIRIAEELLDQVERRISARAAQSGFDGKIVYLCEPGMTLDDVRVEWADGGAERDSARFRIVLEDVIQRVLGPETVDATVLKPNGAGAAADPAHQSA